MLVVVMGLQGFELLDERRGLLSREVGRLRLSRVLSIAVTVAAHLLVQRHDARPRHIKATVLELRQVTVLIQCDQFVLLLILLMMEQVLGR